MKKILGQLSRSFHKNGKSLDEILPQLQEIFDQIQSDPSKDIEKCLNMIVNMSTDNLDLTQKVYKWATDNNYLTEQIATAMVRSYARAEYIDDGISLIERMGNITPHVRTFIPLFQTPLTIEQYSRIMLVIRTQRIIPTAELFSLLISRAPPELGTENFRSLIVWTSQHCDVLDKVVMESPMIRGSTVTDVSEGTCQNCQTPLGVINLNTNQRQLMLNSVFEKDNNPGIMRWVQTRDYAIVIDGANVAHYNNSPFDVRKVITMISKINQAYKNPKILLVFSICRKKQTRGLPKKWKNVDVYYTKAGTNDDLSWLYAALWYPNIWCITNDQMRDHVYYRFTEAVGRNVIDIWMERNIVTFEFNITRTKNHRTNVRMILNSPLSYSVRPQINKDRVHIPISKNQWVCGTVK